MFAASTVSARSLLLAATLFLYKNLIYQNPGDELLFWILCKIMEILSIVSRLMFVSATSRMVLYMYNFVLPLFSLLLHRSLADHPRYSSMHTRLKL